MARSFRQGLITFEEQEKRYREYVASLSNKRFTTGLGEIDAEIRGVAPGEVLTIIAYSGTFKSALLQNLLMQSGSATKTYQLFFSLEMPVEKCFERTMQISTGMTGYDVERSFRDENPPLLAIDAAYQQGGKWVVVIEEGRLDLHSMGNYVDMADTTLGKVGCVGIDYMGLMKAEGKTLFEKAAEVSFGVKEFAKKMNLPVIMLCQVSRAYAASKENEIQMDAAKGGGDIEAGADFMLGLYKHGEELIMKILKNRNGPAGKHFKVDIDASSFRFMGVSPWTPPKKSAGAF